MKAAFTGRASRLRRGGFIVRLSLRGGDTMGVADSRFGRLRAWAPSRCNGVSRGVPGVVRAVAADAGMELDASKEDPGVELA